MARQVDTTHTLMAGTLLVYQRERSAIWQCRFKDVAKLAIAKMEQRLKEGTGKSAYKDYIPIINLYLIPAFLFPRIVDDMNR